MSRKTIKYENNLMVVIVLRRGLNLTACRHFADICTNETKNLVMTLSCTYAQNPWKINKKLHMEMSINDTK